MVLILILIILRFKFASCSFAKNMILLSIFQAGKKSFGKLCDLGDSFGLNSNDINHDNDDNGIINHDKLPFQLASIQTLTFVLQNQIPNWAMPPGGKHLSMFMMMMTTVM